MRPFLKWAGGKYRLVDRIKAKLPPGRRLLEPFAGSCALALNTSYNSFWLNDINADLIRLYRVLQKEGAGFVAYCKTFFMDGTNTPERFYELRKQFNFEKDPLLKSALFVYLNRHGYNGLCRYNLRGEFNTPFGRYHRPYFPEKELLFFAERFKKAAFSHIDFEEMMRSAGQGDVIYCDPPYAPLTGTAKFTAYSTGGFGNEDQLRLVKAAADLAAGGIKTVISNHCNEFILKTYASAEIEIFAVRRSISCDGAKRNPVAEVLAVFG